MVKKEEKKKSASLSPIMVERFTEVLYFAITEIRRKGTDGYITKPEVMSKLGEKLKLTDKTYKSTMEWLTVYRYILFKRGSTSNAQYVLHNSFIYTKSKSDKTLYKQCKFIIAQLLAFSTEYYDDSIDLYKDIVLNTDRFDFIPLIKEQSIKDTVSEVILNEYNEDNKGVYPYEILQTMILTKSLCTIHIKNSQLDIKMKSVKLKKIIFKTDTITLQFDNSKFDIESLGHIKLIEIPKTKGLRNKVDKSLELLQKYDNKSVKPLIDLLTACQNYEDFTF